MDKVLNREIKGLIDEFPKVGTILESFDVGCTTCQVGTCLLKDIVNIHALSPEDEYTLMTQIAQVVYPGKEVEIEIREQASDDEGESWQFSPPMKKLVQEHQWILRLVAMIPAMTESCDLNSDAGKQRLHAVLDFIRSYADQYHHAKEEDILFKYFDEQLDIIQVMFADHKSARAHVAALNEGIDAGDSEAVATHFAAYGALLQDHIKREDEILYPWLDRQLSIEQIGRIYAQFADVDERFRQKAKACEQFVESVERESKGLQAQGSEAFSKNVLS
jgi:hemerythrin-like domain-containing protein